MRSTPAARIGVVGDISGFVVAEDQSLQARFGRMVALARRDMRAEAARLRLMAQGKASAFGNYLVRLRAGRPKVEATPAFEMAPAFEAVPAFDRIPAAERAADLIGLQSMAPRRSKRLAGALALHWLFRVAQMRIAERFSRINRYRVGVATLALAGSLAMGAALFLPDADSPAAAEPVAVPLAQPLPLVQPAVPGSAEVSALPQLAAKADDSWMPVKRPILLYNLEAPDVEASSLVYRVAMRGKTARQDMLTWNARGQSGGGKFKPAVHLVVERFEQAAPTYRPLYSDIASRAAEQGVSIDRMNAPGEIQTKFGGVQVADAVLATEQGPLGCLVFRQIDTVGLVFAGWYCGSVQRPADRVSLSCFIDRLDLVGAGQDHALKKHFAGAERNRKSCAGARQSGRKLTWLDHEAPMPALKLSAKAR